jgi:hypothetical protein
VIGDIASVFHFSASEIWGMEIEDLIFWHEQAVRVSKRNSGNGE